MTKQERMKIPRQEMPLQDKLLRRRNFEEVSLGLPEAIAFKEAERCLQCKKPKCVEGVSRRYSSRSLSKLCVKET